MDFNSLIALIGCLMTMASAIVGAIVYFHNVAIARIDDIDKSLQKKLEAIQKSVISIEKDMIRSSDKSIRRMVEDVEERIEEVEDKNKLVKKEIESVKEAVEQAPKSDYGRVLHVVDPGPIPGSLEARIEYLLKHDEENRQAIANLKKVLKNHQIWFKELLK
jgi:molecular chaperone DnaK (HSP70)